MEVLLQRPRVRARTDFWAVEKSSLHRAFDEGRYQAVEYQIRLGMNPNIRSKDGLTPLMRCTAIRHLGTSIRLIRTLLEHRADPDLTDKEGNTLLQLAIKEDNHVLARLLLTENNTNFHHRDNYGKTVLHALAEKDTFLGRLVLSSAQRFHVNCDVEDDEGLTPLMTACKNGNLEMAQLLIAQGRASTTKRDSIHHKNAYDWLFASTGVYYKGRPEDPLELAKTIRPRPQSDGYAPLREARRNELLKKLLPQTNQTDEDLESPGESLKVPGHEVTEDKNFELKVHYNSGSVVNALSPCLSINERENGPSFRVLRNLYGVYEQQLSAAYRKHVEPPKPEEDEAASQQDTRGPSRAGSGGALSKRLSKAVFGAGLELRLRAKSGLRKNADSGTDSNPNSLAASQDAKSMRRLSARQRRSPSQEGS